MKNLTKNKEIFHAMIERDTLALEFGTLGYTVWISESGEPDLSKLKVNKSRRIKYGK